MSDFTLADAVAEDAKSFRVIKSPGSVVLELTTLSEHQARAEMTPKEVEVLIAELFRAMCSAQLDVHRMSKAGMGGR